MEGKRTFSAEVDAFVDGGLGVGGICVDPELPHQLDVERRVDVGAVPAEDVQSLVGTPLTAREKQMI